MDPVAPQPWSSKRLVVPVGAGALVAAALSASGSVPGAAIVPSRDPNGGLARSLGFLARRALADVVLLATLSAVYRCVQRLWAGSAKRHSVAEVAALVCAGRTPKFTRLISAKTSSSIGEALEEQFSMRDLVRSPSPGPATLLDLDYPLPWRKGVSMGRQISLSRHDDMLETKARAGDCKLVLVMVGLPARGKSYITKHLHRYLSFDGFEAKVFNVGNYRRQLLGSGQKSDFFDPTNEAATQARVQMATSCLEDLLAWLAASDDHHVGIYDATNSTVSRRSWLAERCSEVPGVRLSFLESICTDQEVLRKNYEMKLKNADYSGWDKEAALRDFAQRTAMYEQRYETVEDTEIDGKVSYIKILNCGEKTIQRLCDGFLVSKIVGYLPNMHNNPRVIYLTRHGESEDNRQQRLGGNSRLTPLGMAYAQSLRKYMEEAMTKDVVEPRNGDDDSDGWLLMTSLLRRTRMTARPLVEDTDFVKRTGMRRLHTALLNEISAGEFDGCTEAEICATAPEEHEARVRDKLRYRYPKGESYLDVAQRVRPLVMDIERERRPVLVIAHQAVLRPVLAFFQDVPLVDAPHLEVPLHTVLKLSITVHGCTTERVPLEAIVSKDSDNDPARRLASVASDDECSANSGGDANSSDEPR